MAVIEAVGLDRVRHFPASAREELLRIMTEAPLGAAAGITPERLRSAGTRGMRTHKQEQREQVGRDENRDSCPLLHNPFSSLRGYNAYEAAFR